MQRLTPHYTSKDEGLSVKQTPTGRVGSIPTWGTNLMPV